MQAAALAILEKANLPHAQARAIGAAMDIEFAARETVLATKLDISELRSEMKELKGDLVQWVFLCMLGQTVVLFGGTYFMVTHLSR